MASVANDRTARGLAASSPRPGLAIAVAVAGFLSACLVGVALANSISLGIALLMAIVYLPLVVVSYPLAVCLWIPLVFLEGLPAFNLASKAAGMVLVVGWLGALLAGHVTRDVFTRHRRTFEVFGLLLIWLTLSLAWAPYTDQAMTAAYQWWAIAFVFLIVATSVAREHLLVLGVGMYIVGAVLSLLASGATGGLTGGQRLEEAVGDPNYLASAVLSAVPLTIGMAATRPGAGWRWLWIGTGLFLVAGVVATQSRGGMVAALVMWIAAVVVLPQRRRVIALGSVVAAAAALALAFNPQSWERLTTADLEGTGRVNIWNVAWSVFEDHPLHGVGLSNFARVAPRYVREIGPLEDVALVVAGPNRQVHNSYLQLLAENGIPALVLFVAVVVGCLAAALRAGRMFTEAGRPDLAALAQGIWVGTIGLVATYFFISGGVDRRLWILLGLSLAALEIAHRTRRNRRVTVYSTSPERGEL